MRCLRTKHSHHLPLSTDSALNTTWKGEHIKLATSSIDIQRFSDRPKHAEHAPKPAKAARFLFYTCFVT